jgi:hypothetical protein
MELQTQTKKELQTIVSEVLKASKSEDKRQNSDVRRLSKALRNFLADDKNKLDIGINMEGIRNIIYDLAKYDSSKAKSPSFETRTTRAIKDALLDHSKAGINLKDEEATKDEESIDSYFVRNENDELCLPHNVIEPKIKKDIKGEKQELPNTNTDLVPLSKNLIERYFGEAFPTLSRKGKSALKDVANIEKLIITTNDFLINLLDKKNLSLDDLMFAQSKNIKDNDILEELEGTIEKVITKRTLLEANDKDIKVLKQSNKK